MKTIVEIGTSDFRTVAGKSEGLFIEPVKYYYDRLPECTKENVAVSNREGTIKIFYLTDEEINKHNLPKWIRGCNSIDEIHPTTKTILNKLGISEDIVRCDTVNVVRIKTLLDKHNLKRFDILKIDTEGHDTIILNDFLDTVDFKPQTIKFEYNELSNIEESLKLIARLKGLGYTTQILKTDIVATL